MKRWSTSSGKSKLKHNEITSEWLKEKIVTPPNAGKDMKTPDHSRIAGENVK